MSDKPMSEMQLSKFQLIYGQYIDVLNLIAEVRRLQSNKMAVIHTIGGVDYEGNPTTEINYLQRLRILLDREQELFSLRAENERLREHGREYANSFNRNDEELLNDARHEIKRLRGEVERLKKELTQCAD